MIVSQILFLKFFFYREYEIIVLIDAELVTSEFCFLIITDDNSGDENRDDNIEPSYIYVYIYKGGG